MLSCYGKHSHGVPSAPDTQPRKENIQMRPPVLLRSILISLALFVAGFAFGAPAIAGAPLNGLSDAEARTGWRLPFDGKTAGGWRNYKKDSIGSGWAVENGALSRKDQGAGDILTVDEFESFEFQI